MVSRGLLLNNLGIVLIDRKFLLLTRNDGVLVSLLGLPIIRLD